MTKYPNAFTGLALNDNEFKALAAIVAQWAMAEKAIASHVYRLTLLSNRLEFQFHMRTNEFPVNFKKLHKLWKDALKDVASDSPEHLSIGLSLASAAKTMNRRRNSAAHWPAIRQTADPNSPLRFLNLPTVPAAITNAETFSLDQLKELAEDIFNLACDVRWYDSALIGDLFPSQCTWHGPKPADPILHSRPFPTITKYPRHS